MRPSLVKMYSNFILFDPFVQNEMLEEGHEYAVMLYTWRSCSRAIPQVTHTHIYTHMFTTHAFNKIPYPLLVLHPCQMFPFLRAQSLLS